LLEVISQHEPKARYRDIACLWAASISSNTRLAGEPARLTEIDDDQWLIRFADLALGLGPPEPKVPALYGGPAGPP
jgi:hypothetical protein